jgi:hypothetical protein
MDYLLMAALGGATGYGYNKLRQPGKGPMPPPEEPGMPTPRNIEEFGQDFGPVDEPASPAPRDPRMYPESGPATQTMPGGSGDGYTDSIMKTLGIDAETLRRLARGAT